MSHKWQSMPFIHFFYASFSLTLSVPPRELISRHLNLPAMLWKSQTVRPKRIEPERVREWGESWRVGAGKRQQMCEANSAKWSLVSGIIGRCLLAGSNVIDAATTARLVNFASSSHKLFFLVPASCSSSWPLASRRQESRLKPYQSRLCLLYNLQHRFLYCLCFCWLCYRDKPFKNTSRYWWGTWWLFHGHITGSILWRYL